MRNRIFGLLLVAVFMLSVFAGCGSGGARTSNSAADYAAANQAARPQETKGEAFYGDIGNGATVAAVTSGSSEAPAAAGGETKELDKADAIAGGGNIAQDVSNAILAERKVIRSANVTLEVENFDEAYSKIDTMILGIGFIQSTNINSEKYKVNNEQKLIRRGTVVIRVDKDKFDKVLNSIKGIGDVLNWNINGEDVTDKYFDTESRLRLLRIEEAKLEEYLKKMSDLDQIFKTESRLTDIRYQIESLTGNLKKMSDLVELSTISISINEKYPDSIDPVKPKTYGQKLLDNFLDSFKGVVSFIGELVIILVAAVPVLLLLGVFALIVLFIYRRIPKKGALAQKDVRALQAKEDKDDPKNE